MNSQAKSKTDGRLTMFVGMELRKKYPQIAVMDDGGKVLQNSKLDNNLRDVGRFFDKFKGEKTQG